MGPIDRVERWSKPAGLLSRPNGGDYPWGRYPLPPSAPLRLLGLNRDEPSARLSFLRLREGDFEQAFLEGSLDLGRIDLHRQRDHPFESAVAPLGAVDVSPSFLVLLALFALDPE